MADLKKTVELIFTATDNTGSSLSSLGGGLSNLASNAQSAAQPFADLGETLLKTEAIVLGVAAAIGTKALIEFSKFEDATLELAKVLRDDDSVSNYTEDIDRLSNKYAESKVVITQAMAGFAQANLQGDEAVQALTASLDLAIAGDLDLAKATEVVLQVMAGYKAEVQDLPRYLEALNNVSNNYKTNLDELTKATGRAAPIANALGFSFEELIAIATPIVETFRRGEIAGTALATGLSKITDDANPVVEALDKLGISQTDVNGQLRSGRDIFFDFGDALQTVDKNTQNLAIQQVFGLETGAKLQALFQVWPDIMGYYDTAMEKSGSLTKEVETRLNSFSITAERVGNSINNTFSTLGAQIAPATGEALTGLNALLVAFQNVIAKDPELQAFFDFINEEFVSFGAFLTEVAEALPQAFSGIDFSGLIGSLETLKGSFIGIFDDLDLTKPEDLQRAIQFVVDLLEDLTRNTAGFIEGFTPLLQGLATGASEFNNLSDGAKNAFGALQGVSSIITTVAPIIENFGGALAGLGGLFLTLSTVKSVAEIAKLGEAAKISSGLIGKTGLAGAGLLASGAIGYTVGSGLSWAIDQTIQYFTKSEATLGTWLFELLNAEEGANSLATKVGDLSSQLAGLPPEVSIAIQTQLANDTEFLTLKAQVDDFDGRVAEATTRLETREAQANLDQAQAELDAYVKDYVANATVTISDEAKLAQLKAELAELESKEFEANGRVRIQDQERVTELQAQIAELEGQVATATVEVDTTGAEADLSDFKRLLLDQTNLELPITLPNLTEGVGSAEALGEAYEQLGSKFQVVEDSFSGAVDKFSDGTVVMDGFIKTVGEDGVPVFTQTGDALSDMGDSASDSGKDLKEAEKKAKELEITLLEIASNERIKAMEFTANIEVARIEGQTEQIKAAFESVASTVESTAQATVDLFSLLADEDLSFRSRWVIEDAAEKQLELQERTIANQEKLVAAQIKLMNARSDALRNNDAAITISADGLEPELEAFMFKVLERVRVRATSEYAAFLTATGGL